MRVGRTPRENSTEIRDYSERIIIVRRANRNFAVSVTNELGVRKQVQVQLRNEICHLNNSVLTENLNPPVERVSFLSFFSSRIRVIVRFVCEKRVASRNLPTRVCYDMRDSDICG